MLCTSCVDGWPGAPAGLRRGAPLQVAVVVVLGAGHERPHELAELAAGLADGPQDPGAAPGEPQPHRAGPHRTK